VFAALFRAASSPSWPISCWDQGGPIDITSAIRIVGRGLTIFAVGDHGACRRSCSRCGSRSAARGTPVTDYLALRGASGKDFLIGLVGLVVIIMGWDLMSRP